MPHDAPDILADDGLIRRISEKQTIIDAKGQRRVSSLAFRPSTMGPHPGMSVDLEQQIVEAGHDPRTFVTTPYWIGSIRLVTKDVRQSGFMVGGHPIPDNDHHGEIWGINTKAHQKVLQSMAVWFVPIPGVQVAAA